MVYVQGGNVVGSRTENKMRGGFILDFFWGILNGIVLLCVPGPASLRIRLPLSLPPPIYLRRPASLSLCSRAICRKLSGG